MKKNVISIFAIVLTLCMLTTQMLPLTVFAITEPKITVSQTEVYPGDTAEITVNVENNPGVVSMQLAIGYDESVLTLTEVTDGGLIGASLHTDSYHSPYYLNWVNDTATTNFSGNGTLATLKFKVADNAATNTDLPITVSYTKNNYEIYDKDGVEKDFNLANGNIKVVAKPIPVTGLALDKTSATVETGDETLTLTPVFTPDTATNKQLTWESTDTSVATVADGVVILIKKGVVTISATTIDGNYSASCVVTINCSHRCGDDYPAVPSTCITHGHDAYTVCGECGEIISGSDAELPFADHTGGTADCLHKAVCSVCEKEYGELGNHALTKHERVEPDHNNTGNIEYYTCDVCGKVFSDYLGKNGIELPDTVLAVVPHSYPTIWSTDDNGHWKECACGNKIDFAAHSYDNACDTTCNICGYTRSITHDYADKYSTDATQHWHECSVCHDKIDIGVHTGGTATCEHKAVCSVCGVEYGELAAHTLTHHAAVAADHFKGGNIEYWTCDVCGKYFKDAAGTIVTTSEGVLTQKIDHAFSQNWTSDANQHWHVCSCGEKSGVANHIYSNDCDTTCNICGYTRSITHNYSSEWLSDGVSHWHECSVCGDKTDISAHTGGTADCLHKAVCSVCGKEYGELGAHNYIENTDGKYLKTAATCTHKAVYYKSCSVCGEKSIETFEYGEVNFSNHVGGTYISGQKEASCYEEGYTGDICCSDCHAVITAGTTIAKTAHNPAAVWSTDADYHWKECQTVGCGNIIDKAAHSGGTATCIHKAVCSVCGVEYGTVDSNNHEHTEIRGAFAATEDATGYTGDTYCVDCDKKIATGTVIAKLDHTHNMTAVPAKDATCTSVGNTAYWYCTKCQKYYLDAEGKQEIQLSDTVIPMINHTYSVLQSDANGHWYKCADCDAKTAPEAHTGGTADCHHKAICSVCGREYGELGAHNYVENTDSKYLKTSATCTHKAVYYKSCSVCSEKSTETFEYGEVNPSNHVGDTYIVGQKEATCYEEGYTGDTYCSDCKVMISKGKAIAKTAHNPAAVWSTDADYHWKECQTVGCGNIIDKAAHSGGTATCIHKAVCSVCGVEYGTVDSNNHEHTEIRGAIAPSCTKEGYTGDTYCTDCGAKISSGKVIEKTPHTYVDSVIAPTCSEKGYTLHKCSACDDEYKDTYTNATGHKVESWTVTKEATADESGIKSGKCTICGETVTMETGKLIDKVSDKNTEGNIKATLESVDGTKIYEDIVFNASIITDSISDSDKESMLIKISGVGSDKAEQEIVGVLDLSMIMRDKDSDGNIISELEYQPDGKVRVTVELPEEWFTKFESVVLNHFKDDGSVEKVNYTRNGNVVTFEASGFSNYVFAGEAIAKDPGATDKPVDNTKPSSPQTGDTSNIYLWIALAFVSASVLTGTVIGKKRKTSK